MGRPSDSFCCRSIISSCSTNRRRYEIKFFCAAERKKYQQIRKFCTLYPGRTKLQHHNTAFRGTIARRAAVGTPRLGRVQYMTLCGMIVGAMLHPSEQGGSLVTDDGRTLQKGSAESLPRWSRRGIQAQEAKHDHCLSHPIHRMNQHRSEDGGRLLDPCPISCSIPVRVRLKGMRHSIVEMVIIVA